jgi:response regulator RpfG family c-di-GMP phosphodiesterase
MRRNRAQDHARPQGLGLSRNLAFCVAALIAIAAGIALQLTGTLAGPERESIAARFQLREQPRPSDIVVVAINDVTFSELQEQWPFPRSMHGRVIDRLHAAGASEIVYDVQFTEPTRPREDMALYRAIKRAGGAVLATTEVDENGGTNVLGGEDNLRAIGAVAASSSLPVDPNGLKTRFEHSVDGLPTLAVRVAERAGQTVDRSEFPASGAWIDYRGGPETFPTLSFSRVLAGRFDPDRVRDKIVIVGATAPSLQDIHSTPAGEGPMAGPEVEANAIWTALRGLPLRAAPGPVNLLLVVLMAVLPALAARRLRIVVLAAFAPALGMAYAIAAHLAFLSGTIVDVAVPLATLLVSTVGVVVVSHTSETRERWRVAFENHLLEEKVRERTAELHETQLEVVRRLALAAESRDEETGEHIDRMSGLCYRLGRAVGMSQERAELLRHASLLHDVGKIGIPDRILLKPGKLDADEWEIMKAHTEIGASILTGSSSPMLQLAERIALTHHERWDGSGYPAGLASDAIPLEGRICAICDVYDALVSERPYKRAWSPEEALAEIRKESGSHFDPKLAEAFLALADVSDDELAEWAIGPDAFAERVS